MVGVVIFTHGGMGAALLETARLVVGPLEALVAIGAYPEDSETALQQRLREALAMMDQGDGVLVLVDMFGGTPCNLSLASARSHKLEVVTGVNLPMLLKVVGSQAMSLSALASAVREAGARNVLLLSETMKGAGGL